MTGGPALRDALARARADLAGAGVEEPAREARLLAGLALGIPEERQAMDPGAPVPRAAAARLGALVRRRAAREPFAHIAGVREFMGMELAATPAALVPRPETECLVEALLAGGPARRVLDLGTGSGAILIALLGRWPEAEGVGVDRSEAALRLARRNARRHGLAGRASFALSDWSEALAPAPGHDLAVCNPPYVRTADLAGLDPEVGRHEPRLALDGGADGLGPARAALAGLARVLRPGARVAFETDPPLWDGLRRLFEERGIGEVRPVPDLAGRRRGVLGVWGADAVRGRGAGVFGRSGYDGGEPDAQRITVPDRADGVLGPRADTVAASRGGRAVRH